MTSIFLTGGPDGQRLHFGPWNTTRVSVCRCVCVSINVDAGRPLRADASWWWPINKASTSWRPAHWLVPVASEGAGSVRYHLFPEAWGEVGGASGGERRSVGWPPESFEWSARGPLLFWLSPSLESCRHHRATQVPPGGLEHLKWQPTLELFNWFRMFGGTVTSAMTYGR